MSEKMEVTARDMGDGRFEVCGVVFNAKTKEQAIRKWLRKEKLSVRQARSVANEK